MSERTRVFISYSHDSDGHRARVLALADHLRAEGIDCLVDCYDKFPPEGWQAWSRRKEGVLEIAAADRFQADAGHVDQRDVDDAGPVAAGNCGWSETNRCAEPTVR